MTASVQKKQKQKKTKKLKERLLIIRNRTKNKSCHRQAKNKYCRPGQMSQNKSILWHCSKHRSIHWVMCLHTAVDEAERVTCVDLRPLLTRTRDRKAASSNPGRSGGRIFFSRVNFVCWLFFSVRSAPVLPQWHVKDSGHSAKSAGGRLHLNTHSPLTQTKSELADYAAVQA